MVEENKMLGIANSEGKQDFLDASVLMQKLDRLKPVDHLSEIIGDTAYSEFQNAKLGPTNQNERVLMKNLPIGTVMRSAFFENNDDVLPWDHKLIDIPATDKSARTIYMMSPRVLDEEWRVRHMIVKGDKMVDLIDLIDDDFEVRFSTRTVGHTQGYREDQDKVIYFGPGKKSGPISRMLAGGRSQRNFGKSYLHEAGHSLKQDEERRIFDEVPDKGKILALVNAIPIIKNIFFPILLLSDDYDTFRKKVAGIDRKASAIAINARRRLRKMGADPFPNTSDHELLKFYKRALFTKDILFPGRKESFQDNI